jgi:hypothetical protein
MGTKETLSSMAKGRVRSRVLVALAYLLVLTVSCVSVAVAQAATLPDRRGYEEVSTPAEKGGEASGAENAGLPTYSVSSPTGDTVVFGDTGPVGDTASGTDIYSIAHRTAEGTWSTHAAHPRPQVLGTLGFNEYSETGISPSPDLSNLAFKLSGPFFGSQEGPETGGLYRVSTSGQGEVEWLNQPLISNPLPEPGHNGAVEEDLVPVGGSHDFSTLYFNFSGLLVPEDEARRACVRNGGLRSKSWGFYEWNANTLPHLHEAGVLPDGTVSEFGAVSARYRGPNQSLSKRVTPVGATGDIAKDGAQAYFVSPDPVAVEEELTSGPIELYLRQDGQRGVLVSRMEDGSPAPHGPVEVEYPAFENSGPEEGSGTPYSNPEFVFASANGERAYFESVDALTKNAPANTEPKMYQYRAASNSLTYVPGVQGAIVSSSDDGTRLLFDDTKTEQLDVWQERPGEVGAGEVAVVLGHVPNLEQGEATGQTQIPDAHATPNGNVFIFETNALTSGLNTGGFEQVYRYEVSSRELSCVSCPPAGVTPTGNALFAHFADTMSYLVTSRGMNETGSEVYFDSPDPLVPEDINGKRDVYEWEEGKVSLISSGTGPANSYYDDNSENGEDVFFATSDGLVPGDTDGGYDVYDAREGAESLPIVSVGQCQVNCQGPPPNPVTSSVPASSIVGGSGNESPPPVKSTKAPVKKAKQPAAKKTKRAKKRRRTTKGKAKRARASRRLIRGGESTHAEGGERR